MSNPAPRIGILSGSARANNNGTGICKWVQSHLDTLNNVDEGTLDSTQILSLNTYPLPLGPLVDDIIPQALNKHSPEYPQARDRDFSKIIQSLDALIVVTPQYNWSFPGELKNCFDHLFHEWVDLPIMVITYGGRGGGKCAESIKLVLGGIDAVDVSCGVVGIALPKAGGYIGGDNRVTAEDELLKGYEEILKQELGKLIEAARKRKGSSR
jgi:NAD(P)H-dependent FMN reductase